VKKSKKHFRRANRAVVKRPEEPSPILRSRKRSRQPVREVPAACENAVIGIRSPDQYMPPFGAVISKHTRFVRYLIDNSENSKLSFENCSKVAAGKLTHFYKNLRVSTGKMRKSPRKKAFNIGLSYTECFMEGMLDIIIIGMRIKGHPSLRPSWQQGVNPGIAANMTTMGVNLAGIHFPCEPQKCKTGFCDSGGK